MALPSLRRVRVDRASRSWLREIGIPAVGRRAFLALNVASPLGEALDPLRLDPPLGWGRILPVLRFPHAGPRGRRAGRRARRRARGRRAGRRALPVRGDARSAVRAAGLARRASPSRLRFLAHLVWLDVLYGADPDRAPGGAAGPGGAGAGARAGGDDHRGGSHPALAGLARGCPRHRRSRAGLRRPAGGAGAPGVGGRFAPAGRGARPSPISPPPPSRAPHRAMMRGYVDVGQ